MTTRRIPVAWEYCPNCDAPLPGKIFVGDFYQCSECGEEGVRAPGPYDTEPIARWGAWDWDTTESIGPLTAPTDDDLEF